MNTPRTLKNIVAGTCCPVASRWPAWDWPQAAPTRKLVPAQRDGRPRVLRPQSVVPGGFALSLDPKSRGESDQSGHVGSATPNYYVPWGRGNVGQDIWEGPNPPGPRPLSRRLPGCRGPLVSAGTCGFRGHARAAKRTPAKLPA